MGTDADDGSAITSSTALAVIEEQAEATIRRALHEGRMFFSVIDVIAVLTDSSYPNRYWSDLKRKLLAEGATQPYDKIVRLKLKAPDGRQRETDAADSEALLRIIQSVPSPKAEPVKQWLARVGAQRLDEARRPLDAAESSTAFAAVPKPGLDAPALQWAHYYEQLAAFHVGKYSDIPDAQWPQVAEWLQRRLAASSRRR